MEEATEWHTNIMVVHDRTGYWMFNVQYMLRKKKKLCIKYGCHIYWF
jgi:hypothetical protein